MVEPCPPYVLHTCPSCRSVFLGGVCSCERIPVSLYDTLPFIGSRITLFLRDISDMPYALLGTVMSAPEWHGYDLPNQGGWSFMAAEGATKSWRLAIRLKGQQRLRWYRLCRLDAIEENWEVPHV